MQARQLVIESHHRELARVRSFVVDAAADLGPTVEPADLAVVASELAANAIECEAGPVTITVRPLGGGGIRLEVLDRSPAEPVVHEHEAWDPNGHRGLALVAALSAAWGCRSEPPGKVVWCDLPGSGPNPVGRDPASQRRPA
ncbi:MAG TPA: ATP-binding protein [Acidimicrobiales bacterium]